MKKSIKTKIMTMYLSCFCIFTVCFLLIYWLSVENIKNLMYESVDNSVKRMNQDMNSLLTEAKDMLYIITQDSEMQVSLRSGLPDDQRTLYRERRYFNFELHYARQFNPDIWGVYVFGENGSIYRSAVSWTLYRQDYRSEDWYQRVMETECDYWVPPHAGSFVVHNLYDPVVSLVVPIQDKISYGILGVAAIDISMDIIPGFGEDENLFNGEIFLADSSNRIIYCRDFEHLDSAKNRELSRILSENEGGTGGIREVSIEGERFFLYEDVLDLADWKIINLIPYEDVMGSVVTIQWIMSGILVLCLIMSILAAFSITGQITGPIRRLQAEMQKVGKGDYSVRIDNAGKDELGDLIYGFNVMTGKIEKMVKEEQERQQELMRAELSALQAQINPHFLYNTLDSINWMVRMNRNQEVSGMISALITLFRISLSKGRTFITLKEEVTHVEKYLQLQKIRYSRILNYDISVPEELGRYTIIKVILQPLVENAIYHGLKEKDEPGLIYVRAEADKETITICVEDTGLGILPEKLQEIRQMMKQEKEYDSKSYGIINVQRRIKTYFGSRYGLRIESTYSVGTKVFVTIPKREEAAGDAEAGDR